jgi:hypothetical protein
MGEWMCLLIPVLFFPLNYWSTWSYELVTSPQTRGTNPAKISVTDGESILFIGDSQVFFGYSVPYGFLNVLKEEMGLQRSSVQILGLGKRGAITSDIFSGI